MSPCDLSEHFPSATAAEGEGRAALILYRLDAPRRNLDGETCHWELCYRALSRDADEPGGYACVEYAEVTLYPADQIDPGRGLFEQFRLFP